MTRSKFISQSELRQMFSSAMSEMYMKEVPLYKDLMDMVKEVNKNVLMSNPGLREELEKTDNLDRISEERHGAIRLGTPEELKLIRRLFAVMGMEPVDYYDLSVRGLPIHSTAFRVIDYDQLKLNSFRVFTSLLRIDLIEDKRLRKKVEEILNKRNILSKRTLELIEDYEKNGGLTVEEGKEFITEALKTFKWRREASMSKADYEEIKSIHQLVADIACFQGPHINHLTPRTLDIEAVQHELETRINQDGKRVFKPKAGGIEGPPHRKANVLLRQTSFTALVEPILFPTKDGGFEEGEHQARFGEIEMRGLALRSEGRQCYDRALNESVVYKQKNPKATSSELSEEKIRIFEKYLPDDLEELRQQDLGYFYYIPTDKGIKNAKKEFNPNKGLKLKELIDNLLNNGYITFSPIIYEDFLPASAAGIFTSNLSDRNRENDEKATGGPDKEGFEKALGAKIYNSFKLYSEREANFFKNTLRLLSLIPERSKI